MSGSQKIKSEWFWGPAGLPELGDHVTMHHPLAKPCNNQCPWLCANQDQARPLWYDHEVPGIAMPEGDFTFAGWKRAEVWDGDLRDGRPGYGSLCHVRRAGTEQNPDGSWNIVGHQCTSALVMQQRELLRYVEGQPSALSHQGAVRVAGDMMGRAIDQVEIEALAVSDLLPHAHPRLLDCSIGAVAVAPLLTAQEISRWGGDRAASKSGESSGSTQN